LSGQGTSYVTVEWDGNITDGVLSVTASSASGCVGEISTISVDVVVGVEDLVFSQNLDVFPSPTSSTITVYLDGAFALSNNLCEIYSISGQKMMAFTLSQSEIDVSGLSNGTYLITVDTERGLIRQSFVVAK
ncbi:MAG: T9SS type A sorting domain-containing protein, partial [Bacteroidetes bacterium]|nr:T9SS type A sorting domain-containing protein [Bacteroidota bacterium]